MRLFKRFWTLASITLRAGCFYHCFNSYVLELNKSQGPSMLPYFGTSGIILTDNLSRRFREFQRGDVVICKSPETPNRQVMKRIIGLPGDNICKDPTAKEREYLTVPRGYVWVGGDNLSMSKDSRMYGPVPLAMVRGRVLAKVWPEFEVLKNNFVLVES